MMALLKAQIGSSSFSKCWGIFFKSVSRPTHRNERLARMLLMSCCLFITVLLMMNGCCLGESSVRPTASSERWNKMAQQEGLTDTGPPSGVKPSQPHLSAPDPHSSCKCIQNPPSYTPVPLSFCCDPLSFQNDWRRQHAHAAPRQPDALPLAGIGSACQSL